MPYEWVIEPKKAPEQSGAFSYGGADGPLAKLHAWPNRSLPKKGFVLFIGVTWVMLMLPMVALLGTAVLWGLLPFMLGALALIWWSLQRSYKDGELLEELTLWRDHITLTQQSAHKPAKHWEANPHWVEPKIRPTGGPVGHYITLRGNNREVELGKFLSEDERESLFGEIQVALRRAG